MKIILLADSDHKRTKGLMFHADLNLDECAFFNFPRVGQHCFWNKNVDFPISLIFCDKEGVVRDIKRLNAQQTESVRPESFDIKYVIETHIDAPHKYKIKKGMKIDVDGNRIVLND